MVKLPIVVPTATFSLMLADDRAKSVGATRVKLFGKPIVLIGEPR